MRIIAIVVVSMLFSASARADDAVLFSYTLEEQLTSDSITTSEFGFLVNFEKDASASIGNTAQLDMYATDLGDKVRVNLALLDFIDGSFVEVGRASVDVTYGTSSQVSWQETDNREYRLSIAPSRHTLPQDGV